MSKMETPKEYKGFAVGVVITSTVFGIAGGLLPFGFGAIPGGIAGLVVGIIWVRIMMRRIQTPGTSIAGPAFRWGGLMGFLAAVFLHGTMVVLIGSNLYKGEGGIGLGIEYFAALVGLPIGLVAGLILGAICGNILKSKVERASLRADADQPDHVQAGGEGEA